MNADIIAYNQAQQDENKAICELLAQEIQQGLPGAENKVWHGAPVWFLQGNPIAGYDVLKNSVRLLFWSGRSFDEPGLTDEGSFKAAEARYTAVRQIDLPLMRRWLQKATVIQWNYKDIVKNKGRLDRL
jgi:hypothetical protein